MTDQDMKPGIGEARSRQKVMKQLMLAGFATVIGALVGFFVGFFDQGDGNLFQGDWDELSLNPTLALVLAATLIFALVALPIFALRMLDEFNREHNYIAFTAGAVAVLGGFPAWALLYAGGFTPAPHAFGVWAIGFVSMYVGYAYARWLR